MLVNLDVPDTVCRLQKVLTNLCSVVYTASVRKEHVFLDSSTVERPAVNR